MDQVQYETLLSNRLLGVQEVHIGYTPTHCGTYMAYYSTSLSLFLCVSVGC